MRHGLRRYPAPRRGASAILLVRLLLGAAALVLAAPVHAAPVLAEHARPLKPDGSWKTVTIDAPGKKVVFAFDTVAGARYRVSALPGTLVRPVLEIGPGRDTVYRVDAGVSGQEASHDFYAERDGSLSLRVGGFSTLTGTARVRLEPIDPDGKRTSPHRRVLATGATLARVGELWLGEANRWDLAVAPGKAYEVRSTMGTAGRVTLAVVASPAPPGTAPLATTDGLVAPFPALRFLVPAAPSGPDAVAVRHVLEVRGAGGAGGTYGLYLREIHPSEVVPERGGADGPEVAPAPVAAPAAKPGLIDDVPLAFRAGPGDVAMLFLAAARPFDPHTLLVKDGTQWKPVPADPISPYGERASVRTPEGASAVAFRSHVVGEFRFVSPVLPGAPGQPVLRVYDGAAAGGAPLLLGAPSDPMILGRSRSPARVLGLGFCIPGFDYLFVAAGGGARELSMRVKAMDGTTIVERKSGAFAATEVAGVGPSLRFRVKEPQVVRLEVSGGSWRGYGLLRRASN